MSNRFLRAIDRAFDLMAQYPKLTWGWSLIIMGCVMAVLVLLSTSDPTPPSPQDTLVDRRLWLFPAFMGVSFIVQGAGELLPRDRPGIGMALRIANLGVIVAFLFLAAALIRSCTPS